MNLIYYTITLVGIALTIMSVYIIRPIELGVIERLGKFKKISSPGFHMLIPFIDTLRRVTIVEQTVDVPKQPVITKDNVSILVDGVVYLKVLDVKKSLYSIDNYKLALTTIAQTNLRAIIGTMDLDEVLNNRDQINARMVDSLDKKTSTWGVDILNMEIQELTPPKNILKAMESQVVAERNKREAIINSEARKVEAINLKEAEILNAEADKQSKILKAEGHSKEILLTGEAEAKTIKLINEQMSLHGEKYVELKRIERWDGSVPQFMSSGNDKMPFLLNLDSNLQKKKNE